ncbi:MAG: hypothetical protein M3487_00905 [Actinomycetota bacterium]|nr:hypothetical protein [Acidimicrobiia bacterium]MDQ3468328.1 hypothetical protein [Actinomycetota bacterium]
MLSDAPGPAAAAGVPRLRSPLTRAVAPVAGGLAVIALIMAATWFVAFFISRGGADSTERLAPTIFQVGDVERVAASVSDGGPLIFPGLDTTTGARTLVLDHEGDDPARGWVVRWAHPADRPPSCVVEQVRTTRAFTDCDGRTLDVSDLQPGVGARPIVENRRVLSIDLRAATTATTTAQP